MKSICVEGLLCEGPPLPKDFVILAASSGQNGHLLPFTAFSAFLALELSFNIFDLNRNSQETDSLFPNIHPRPALATIPTVS